jgi:hypothetical protein
MDYALQVLLLGIGATVATDAWGALRRQLFGVPLPDYSPVGRWFGHMPRALPPPEDRRGGSHEARARDRLDRALPDRHRANLARLQSFVTDAVFSLGLYATALALRISSTQ